MRETWLERNCDIDPAGRWSRNGVVLETHIMRGWQATYRLVLEDYEIRIRAYGVRPDVAYRRCVRVALGHGFDLERGAP